MYDLIGYGSMIADRVRTDAYAKALEHAIRPDSVVLDIGTGTGLFALLACRLGARRVYAVEPDDAIAVARDIARCNGFSERIEFVQDLSFRVELPEKVDIVVSDIRGVLPLYARSVQAILDARRRFLADGGVLIPRRDRLMAAPVDAPNLYEKHTNPWETSLHGIDMRAAARYVKNTWHNGRARPEQLVAKGQCLGELDYASLADVDLKGAASWELQRDATLHGLAVWFESDLAPDLTISSSPESSELVYGSAFFPLQEPVCVAKGDYLEVELRVDQVNDDYVWSWRSRVRRPEPHAWTRARFSQSSFFASPFLESKLRSRAADHRPALSEEGDIALLVLNMMRDGCTLERISREVSARFSSRFPTWRTALDHVGTLSTAFARNSRPSAVSSGAGTGEPESACAPLPTRVTDT